MFYQLFLLVTTLLSIYIWKQRHSYYLTWKLGGSFGYPFLGSLIKFSNRTDVLHVLAKEEEKHKSPYVEWLGPLCVVVSSDPDTMETILTSPKCVNKSFVYNFLRDIIGDGLFTSNVPLWNTRVKIVKPTFKRRMILGFYNVFNEEAKKFLCRIEEGGNNENFSLFFNIQLAALIATCQTTLGDSHSDAEKVDFRVILESFSYLMYAMIDRMFKPYYFDSRIYNLTNHYKNACKHRSIIVDFVHKKVISKKLQIQEQYKKKLENNSNDYDDDNEFKSPLSLLEYICINNENCLSTEELESEIYVLIAAGFETTAVALYCAIMCISMHEEEQEKLYEELCDILPDRNTDITEEHIKDLRYTEMCINESMRVISPVPVVGRVTMDRVELKNGIILEKNTDVMLDIFNMQRSKKHWGPNALKFDPENFHPDKIKDYHPYAFIPFTKGSRMCVGFKYSFTLMKIFVAKLFRNYKISANMKFEDLQFIENISIKVKTHPTYKFEKRFLIITYIINYKYKYCGTHHNLLLCRTIDYADIFFKSDFLLIWQEKTINTNTMLSFLFIICAIFLYFWKQKQFYIMHWKLKGDLGLPILGSLFNLNNPNKILKFFSQLEQKYQSPYVTWVGTYPMMVSSDPDTMETILTSPHCVNKSFVYAFLTDLIGDGLFSSTVPLWYSRVKIMKPAFKRKIILSFYSVFNESSWELIDNIEKNGNIEDYNFFHAIQLIALKATFKTTLGEEYSEVKCVDFDEMLNIFKKLMGGMIERIFKPWFFDSRIYKFSSHYNNTISCVGPLLKYLDEKIEYKWKENELEKLKTKKFLVVDDDEEKPYVTPVSFLDYIFKIEHKMTPINIRDEIIVLIGAGFETTAVALYITILCLAMHPVEQERLFNELILVFPHKDFEVNEENIKSDLVFTEMCINESLRVISPTPLVGRINIEDIKLKDGTIIKKGTDFVLDIFNMQRSEKHWGPDAKKFKPDNFHPDNLKYVHPYSHIPFTKGQRMCIGFKYSITFMKLFLARIFRNYRITTDMKFEELEFVENISMKFERHPKFVFEKRQ
ncbi:uncharacterized protein LOC129612568 [Condylostylus longicornis]|uniref:uncharacterized protein LOC129612568 n=1 Tax=Condylostylus longicornis TaxID=2530218 RepID=UPI00244E4171|nr:uncharacterized protein LOC129612568 [Condylostylus longicornis]